MSKIIDFLFPPSCVSCGETLKGEDTKKGALPKGQNALCPDCRAEWEREKLRICRVCGLPMVDCRCMRGVMHRAGCETLLRLCTYHGGEQKTVNALVFCMKRDALERCEAFLATQLAAVMRHFLSEQEEEGWIFTNVPRRQSSVIKYGYDHAARLAEMTAERLGLPYAPLLKRRSEGSEQKALSSEERAKNVLGIFDASPFSEQIAGRKIILVDDVVTTGSSMAESSKALFMAGASRIVCACVASTETKF